MAANGAAAVNTEPKPAATAASTNNDAKSDKTDIKDDKVTAKAAVGENSSEIKAGDKVKESNGKFAFDLVNGRGHIVHDPNVF